jgi:hypothetical protein
MSLASITFVKQTREENESRVSIQVHPSIVRYTPNYIRRKHTICNHMGGKSMISLVIITRKLEPRTLKLKESIKGKNIAILVDYGSTHHFVDINLAKKLNIFLYLVTDFMVTIDVLEH